MEKSLADLPDRGRRGDLIIADTHSRPHTRPESHQLLDGIRERTQ